jgi:hypothetical protein
MTPEKSQASIKEGIWYVFEDGNNIIKLWCSSLSGKEKLYLNEKLISEKRSMRMTNEYSFKDDSGLNYSLILKTTNLLKGHIVCRLERNGEHVRTIKSKVVLGKNFTMKRILILVFATVVYTLFKIQYNLSDTSFLIFLALVLIVHFRTREKEDIIIEE